MCCVMQGDPSRQPQHGCGEGNSPEDRASAPPELGHLAEQCTGAGVQAKGAATPADAQVQL